MVFPVVHRHFHDGALVKETELVTMVVRRGCTRYAGGMTGDARSQ